MNDDDDEDEHDWSSVLGHYSVHSRQMNSYQ